MKGDHGFPEKGTNTDRAHDSQGMDGKVSFAKIAEGDLRPTLMRSNGNGLLESPRRILEKRSCSAPRQRK